MAQSISNSSDVGRKWSTSALAPNVLSESEGVVLETIQGPTSGGSRSLSRPAVAIRLILEYVTATGALVGVRLVTSHYTVSLEDAVSGVAILKDASASDRSANSWAVWYSPLGAEGSSSGSSLAR